MVKVSVIMPSLNVEKYIHECITSVLKQTLRDIEILCIDAGSTDGTWEILQEYAEQDDRIKVIRSDRKSYGYQVNLGLEQAQGKYIAILETDDFIRETMYETLYAKAEEFGVDYVKADYDSVVSLKNGEYQYHRVAIGRQVSDPYRRVLTQKDLLPMVVADRTLWKGIYRRTFIEENHIRLNESPGAAYQDTGFLLQVFAHVQTAMYVDDSFYCYRMDREDASIWNPKSFVKQSQEIEWILRQDFWNDLDEDVRKYLCMRMMISYLWGMRHSVCSLQFEIEEEEFQLEYRGFCSKIKEWKQAEYLQQSDFTNQIWNDLNLVETDLEMYRQMQLQNVEKRNNFFDGLKEKAIIIFGSGIRGISLLDRAIQLELCVLAICDNNRAFWGEKRQGVVVRSLDECRQLYPDAYYVITMKRGREEVMMQLQENGIAHENIVVFDL